MRGWLMRTCVLTLGVAAASPLQAQRMAKGIVPPSAVERRLPSFGSLGPAATTAGTAMGGWIRAAKPALPAIAQADSLTANDTHAQTGAVIGGLVGAVGGALAFAHFTHRTGGNNSTTGTLGGAFVGAGLIGTLGALAGLVIGSAIHE